ncbi:MAG: hypothetical protein HQL69_20505 [Magnetococcales bacterium]|nr:hypothetical protein [Magnetococcales bacterium]
MKIFVGKNLNKKYAVRKAKTLKAKKSKPGVSGDYRGVLYKPSTGYVHFT